MSTRTRMHQRRQRFVCALLLQISLAAGTQAAAGVPDYRIGWYVISAGDSVEAVSENFRLHGTLAQPIVGFSASSGYILDAGFWSGMGDSTCTDCIFVNGFERTGVP